MKQPTVKNLSVLGSTGSIGTQALNVVRRYPDRFRVAVLAAKSHTELLAAQAREFKPELIAVTDERAYLRSEHLFAGMRVIFRLARSPLANPITGLITRLSIILL